MTKPLDAIGLLGFLFLGTESTCWDALDVNDDAGVDISDVIGLLGYLFASAVVTPHLWADPLGPMLKVLPAIGLAVVLHALAEER